VDAQAVDSSGHSDASINGDVGDVDAETIAPNARFVSLDGDDANDGSMDRPWRTVAYAVSHLEGGHTLYIRQGTYHLASGDVNGTYDPNRDVLSPPSGEAGKPTVIRAYPGEEAVVDGSKLFTNHWNGVIGISTKAHIRIQDLTIIGTYALDKDGQPPSGGFCGAALDGHGYADIFIAGSDDIEIRNVVMRQSTVSCLYANSSTNLVILGNELDDCNKAGCEEVLSISNCGQVEVGENHVHDAALNYRSGQTGQQAGIDIKDGSHDVSVHHNVVQNVNNGIYMDARGDMHDIEVFGNYLDGEGHGRGLELANEVGGDTGAHEVRIYNNVIVDWSVNAGIGWYRLSWTHNNNFWNVWIFNNTFFGGQLSFQFGLTYAEGNVEDKRPHDIYFYNNILAITDGTALGGEFTDRTSFVVDHNVIFGSPGSIDGDATLPADPLFVSPDSGSVTGFRLQSASPACSFGSTDTNLPYPDVDFEGTARNHVGSGAFACP